MAQIVGYCRLVARAFRPRKIILFGSYAYGRPTWDSDVDLLVIMPHRSGPVRQSVAIRQRCAAPFPLDLLVWTPAYARKRQSWNDSFTREVFGQGKVMYEAGARLSDYAVRLRYPGITATRAEAKRAVRDCRAVRGEIRLSLGLP